MSTGLTSRATNRKRHKDKHKEFGLCVCCSEKAEKNRVRCKYHLKKNIEYKKNVRQYKQMVDWIYRWIYSWCTNGASMVDIR